jgi:hypothetical protein
MNIYFLIFINFYLINHSTTKNTIIMKTKKKLYEREKIIFT